MMNLKTVLAIVLLTLSASASGAYNPANPNGQATMANSQPVVIASNQSGIPVTGTFWQVTQPVSGTFWQATQPVSGTFWQATQPVSLASTTVTGSVAVTGPLTDTQLRASAVPVSLTSTTLTGTSAISAASLPLPAGAATSAKQPALGTAGTPSTDVLTVQGSASGTALPVSLASVPTHAVTLTSTTITGSVATTGTYFQATQPVSIATMPSTPVTGTFWQATQPVSGTFWQATQPVSAASLPLPTGAATETTLSAVNGKFVTAVAMSDGGTGNPTTTTVGAVQLLYNGTTLDRQRGNNNFTTTDNGAKTASFSGSTQTNYNARGALVTLLLGTVTGTSPTLVMQLQWSPDSGTTWITLGAATTALTASNQSATIVIYPGAASTVTGSNQTTVVNSPLPRTWRVNITIGGTTPSFQINGIAVAYVN